MTRVFILIFILFLALPNVSFGQIDYTSLSSQSTPSDSATVFVSFIVETNGKITNIKVSKILCRKCNKEYKETLKNEATKLIQKMPEWETQVSRTRYILPIKFKLTYE